MGTGNLKTQFYRWRKVEGRLQTEGLSDWRIENCFFEDISTSILSLDETPFGVYLKKSRFRRCSNLNTQDPAILHCNGKSITAVSFQFLTMDTIKSQYNPLVLAESRYLFIENCAYNKIVAQSNQGNIGTCYCSSESNNNHIQDSNISSSTASHMAGFLLYGFASSTPPITPTYEYKRYLIHICDGDFLVTGPYLSGTQSGTQPYNVTFSYVNFVQCAAQKACILAAGNHSLATKNKLILTNCNFKNVAAPTLLHNDNGEVFLTLVTDCYSENSFISQNPPFTAITVTVGLVVPEFASIALIMPSLTLGFIKDETVSTYRVVAVGSLLIPLMTVSNDAFFFPFIITNEPI